MIHLALLFTLAQVQVPPVQVPPVQAPPITQPSPPAQVPAPLKQQPAPITDLSASMQPYEGTLSSVNGTTAQVKFADGTSKSYTIDATTSASLSAQIGKPLAFRIVQGNMQLAKDVKHATLQNVKDGVAILKDPSSKATSTAKVTSDTQTQAEASVGKTIAYTVGANDTLILVSDQAPPNP